MNKIIFGFVVLLLTVTACAPQAPTESPSIIIEQPEDEVITGAGLSPLEYAVVNQLSKNLGLDIKDVSVSKNEIVEFGDGCLGVPMQDVMCAQVITSGHVIVLEANGTYYEYHTDEDGLRMQPATIALTWSRDGGIAGFCDRLTVFLSGEVFGSQCKSQDGRMGIFTDLLSVKERSQFNSWMGQYGEKTLDASDPKGTADGMLLVIELFGDGKGKPGKPVQEEIFTWAQAVFQELYK